MPGAVSLLAWGRLIDAGARARHKARAALKAAGLPPPEWYDILQLLGRHGAQRPRDIQHKLGIEQYTLSRLLARMDQAGLVAMQPCTVDRRGQITALTAQGEACRAAMWPTYAAAIRSAIEARLDPDERVQLAVMLEKIA